MRIDGAAQEWGRINYSEVSEYTGACGFDLRWYEYGNDGVVHDIAVRGRDVWLVEFDAAGRIIPEHEMIGPFESEEAAYAALMLMYESGLL